MDENKIEVYLNQFRVVGMDEETIEIYKQQIIQSKQLSTEINSFHGSLSQFEDFLDIDFGDSVPILSISEQWGIACGANLAYRNGQSLNSFKSGLAVTASFSLLSNVWGVNSREVLFETLKGLEEKGSRYNYEFIAYAYTTLEPSKIGKYFVEDLGGIIEEEEAATIFESMKEVKEQFVKDGFLRAEQPIPNTMIWDYGRMINLCRFGLDCDYLTKREAKDIIAYAAKKIQLDYRSWKELGIAYVFARCLWAGLRDYGDWIKGVTALLSDETSPWITLDWNTELE